MRAMVVVLIALLLGVGLAQSKEEQEMARNIEQFMKTYDPNRSYGAPGGTATYGGAGSDLLSLFIQAYNLARQFYRALPPIYLRNVQDPQAIRNKILDRGTYEIIAISGKVGRLPSGVVQALQERVFIPDRTYPNLRLTWSMAKEDLPKYAVWEKQPGLRAQLNLTARGEDVALEVLGVTEALGFGFLMMNNDLYLYTSAGQFFLVDPGPAGAFIPWVRLLATQVGDAKGRQEP